VIHAAVVLEAGRLASCRVTGHAGAGPRGGDVVCAAVSALTRAAALALRERPGIEARAEAPARGAFRLEARATGPLAGAFLEAAGAILTEGLQAAAREYPRHCEVSIERRN